MMTATQAVALRTTRMVPRGSTARSSRVATRNRVDTRSRAGIRSNREVRTSNSSPVPISSKAHLPPMAHPLRVLRLQVLPLRAAQPPRHRRSRSHRPRRLPASLAVSLVSPASNNRASPISRVSLAVSPAHNNRASQEISNRRNNAVRPLT